MTDPKRNQAQSDAFTRAARHLGADESDDALDRAMDKLDLKAKPKPDGDKEPDKR